MGAEEIAERQVEADGGVSLLVMRDGREEMRLAKGVARPGFPMGRDTILLWLSAGKPVTATVIARLYERGEIGLEEAVARYLPEFGQNGKGSITVRHLLTHMAGLQRVLPGAWNMEEWESTIARICAAPVAAGFVPGEHAAYDGSAGWFVLGEIIRRVTGEPFETVVRREVFDIAGMPEAAFSYNDARAAELATRLAQYSNTASERVRVLEWNEPPLTRMARPGASLRATIGEMARFYQAMLDRRLMAQGTQELFTSSARGMRPDRTFGAAMDWGLGFMVKGEPRLPYSFGATASGRAFGHGGQQSSIAYADPERRMVFVAGYTTLPGERAHSLRMAELMAAAEDQLRRVG